MIQLGFIGDIGLTKAVQETIDAQGPHHVFAAVKEQLNSYDLLIGNFEGCVSSDWGEYKAVNKLCLSPSFLEVFQQVGFDVFSLCNNHILDAGPIGVQATIDALDQNRYRHFGAGLSLNQAEKPLFIECKGKTIAFIGACDVQHLYAKSRSAGVAPMITSRLIRRVVDAKLKSDVVIVVLHADLEFYRHPSPSRRRLCQALADCGVNVVLQHHPHVVQSSEYIRDCLVVYSIGNFVFSIHGNEYMERREGVRNGVIAEITIADAGKATVNMRHIYIGDDHCPIMANLSMVEEQDQLLQQLNKEVGDGESVVRAWQQACAINLKSALQSEYYYLRRHGILKSIGSMVDLLSFRPFWQWVLGVITFGHY